MTVHCLDALRLAVTTILNAHGASNNDVQCVDWEGNEHGSSHMIATGAQDGSVRVWDLRRMESNKSFLCSWTQHTGGIIRLEWNPHARGVLASGGDDHLVNIWRLQGHAYDDKVPYASSSSEAPEAASISSVTKKRKESSGSLPPSELMFMHGGHRKGKVVDFQWLRDENLPWTMLSVSVDESIDQSDGQMQVWRMNPLIHMDEEEAIEALSAHQEWILKGTEGKEPATKKIPVTKIPEEQPADQMEA
jgi:WD40 repeat protein